MSANGTDISKRPAHTLILDSLDQQLDSRGKYPPHTPEQIATVIAVRHGIVGTLCGLLGNMEIPETELREVIDRVSKKYDYLKLVEGITAGGVNPNIISCFHRLLIKLDPTKGL